MSGLGKRWNALRFSTLRLLRLLLRQALDGELPKRRVFLADLVKLLPFRHIEPSLNLLHTVPNLNYYTRLRRFSFERCHVLSCGKETSTSGFDQCLSFGAYSFP
jgi:hypothetical protein